MEWYYVVVPIEAPEMELQKFVFGPYKTYDAALEVSDRVGGWDIVSLGTPNLDSAIEVMRKEGGMK